MSISMDEVSGKLFIPYDIIDIIIGNLDIESSRNFLLSSSRLYNDYRFNSHFYVVFIKKVFKFFPSLNKIPIDDIIKTKCDNIKVEQMYNMTNKIFNHFKKHIYTSLADMLIYICESNDNDKYMFELIVSYCYFSKNGDNVYNALKADDLVYLLMFTRDISVITKYIFVDATILLHVIKYKINMKHNEDVLYLINYLLFKHFFRYSEFVEGVISEIACELVKKNNYEVLELLYKKQDAYKFKLNYQKIINVCMQQSYVKYLELIYEKMNIQNKLLKSNNLEINHIIISKDYVHILMKNKYYDVLECVIQLYLGNLVNMGLYFNEIYNNYNKECSQLLKYFSKKNQEILKSKCKC